MRPYFWLITVAALVLASCRQTDHPPDDQNAKTDTAEAPILAPHPAANQPPPAKPKNAAPVDDRKRVADLIADVEKDRSKAVDLAKLTGRDFGARPELWTKWLRQKSDQQLAQIQERKRRAEELESAWHEFALFQTGLGDKLLKESTEPKACDCFFIGLDHLTQAGDRTGAAKRLREGFELAPLSHYAAASDELAVLLEVMAEEDKGWVEHKELDKLPLKEKIRYYAYHLRDRGVKQRTLSGKGVPRSPDAASELRNIGKDAIPALIGMLDDRRPTCSVRYWRAYWPDRTVERYQDVALELLDSLLPVHFYHARASAAHLSSESPEVRYRVISRIREWHKAGEGKSEPERLWVAVKMKLGIHPTIKLLKALAQEHGQKAEVLKELHAMYQNLHRAYRPFIGELMAELGDVSKVNEVVEMLNKNEFQSYFGERFEDDSALFLNAKEAAERVKAKYGPKPQQPDEKK
jgi:hypothetical protein